MRTIYKDRQRIRIFTKTDLSLALGINLTTVCYRIRAGLLPPPDVFVGKKLLYSEADFNELVSTEKK